MHRYYYYTNIGIVIVATLIIAAAAITGYFPQKIANATADVHPLAQRSEKAPIATSGDNNVNIAWWSNKTGNDEVMFKASTDGGKMNLSNSPNSESQDVEIAASGNNVYVTWWERNQTMNEPVMRVSNDNGKTFGQEITLSKAGEAI
jgi:hypothetical protein